MSFDDLIEVKYVGIVGIATYRRQEAMVIYRKLAGVEMTEEEKMSLAKEMVRMLDNQPLYHGDNKKKRARRERRKKRKLKDAKNK